MQKITFLLLIFFHIFNSVCSAQSSIEQASASVEKASPVQLDLPIIDTPFNFSQDGYTFPSMLQSLTLSTDFYESLHWSIAQAPVPETTIWRRLAIIGVDILAEPFPLSDGWMHEEWHRAVMSKNRISSYNDVYNIPIGQELIAVSHVRDADLIRLKHDHPYDQVRLSAAGMESQTMQNLLIEHHHFYDNSPTFDAGVMWLNAVGNWAYLSTCSSGEADSSTNKQNREDGASISKRDFTGLDCTAWVYDLFRPNEPYTARGTHPSGVGIDRYIKYSDLSNDEQKFLKLQTQLSLLNLIDPFLIGRDHFHGHHNGSALIWNARLSHYLTSFGYTVDANLFLNYRSENYLVQLHNGFNDERYYPGLTIEHVRESLPWPKLSLTTTATIWTQPHGQDVKAKSEDLLLAGSAKLFYNRPSISPYIGVNAKTPGWMAGNVYLEKNISFWTGIAADVF
jgi:hypothetical protein